MHPQTVSVCCPRLVQTTEQISIGTALVRFTADNDVNHVKPYLLLLATANISYNTGLQGVEKSPISQLAVRLSIV